jgi:phosphoglycerate dehydrogenase-like enzyme
MSAPVVCWGNDFQPHPGFQVAELRAATPQALAEAEACIGFPTPEQLAAMPRLRWLQLMSAGAERWLHVPASILLTSANSVFAEPAAEHALALLLALGRDLPSQVRHGLAQRWTKSAVCRDLAQAQVALLGLGSIGRAIAVRLGACGARVTAFRRHGDAACPPGVLSVRGFAELAQALPLSDAVVLALPATPATQGLLSRDLLALLKPGALVVNVGRGSTIDQDALVDGLRSGRIGGAGLDVTVPEPLPPGHPLWTLEQVLISGHSVNTSSGKPRRWTELVNAQLGRWQRGEPLLYQVDRTLGY